MNQAAQKKVSLRSAQITMALGWLISFAAGVLLLASSIDRFGERFSELVGWYSQAELPTLAILVSAMYATRTRRSVPRELAFAAVGTVFFYQLLVVMAVYEAFKKDGPLVIEHLNRSSLLLGILQMPMDAALVFTAVKSTSDKAA